MLLNNKSSYKLYITNSARVPTPKGIAFLPASGLSTYFTLPADRGEAET